MKKIVIVAIVLFATNILKAQNQIQGMVLEWTEDGTTIPVFGANVYWEGTNVGTVTDLKGHYSIAEAAYFPAILSVSYIGYTIDTNLL